MKTGMGSYISLPQPADRHKLRKTYIGEDIRDISSNHTPGRSPVSAKRDE